MNLCFGESLLPADANAEDATPHIDEQVGTVDLTIDARGCSPMSNH